jgi:hypothetical protein
MHSILSTRACLFVFASLAASAGGCAMEIDESEEEVETGESRDNLYGAIPGLGYSTGYETYTSSVSSSGQECVTDLRGTWCAVAPPVTYVSGGGWVW